MERNFPVIPIFRTFRPTSRGTPKFRNEIPENVCSIRSPSRNFRNFWSNGKRSMSLLTERYELNKLTPLPMYGFIAQVVEHRTGIRGGHGF